MRKATFLYLIITAIFPLLAKAQTDTPEMADALYSNGKIYVVVLVLATIFAGIIAFLVYLERKVKKLEQEKQS